MGLKDHGAQARKYREESQNGARKGEAKRAPPPVESLTDIQTKGLAFIRQRIERSGAPPTLREICTHMGWSAIGSAQDLVATLRRKGWIADAPKAAPRAARSLMLSRRARQMINDGEPTDDRSTFVIPCLGAVPAGNPTEAIEDRIGTMRMSVDMFRKPHPRPEELFALRAKGDSMIEAGIHDGDWLVVRSEKSSPSGAIVVARLEDGEATVKRLMQDESGDWLLKPENPRYRVRRASDSPFEVIGQVLALQRSIH